MLPIAHRTPPLLYVETDLQERQTLAEWRRSHRPARRPRGLRRFVHRNSPVT